MALRVDLADAPGPPHGPLFGLAQITVLSLLLGFVFNIPFGLALWLVSFVIPPLSAEGLSAAVNVPVEDLWWRVTTPVFAAIVFALLFAGWISARNWRPPNYGAPMRTLMARLRRLRRSMPMLAHRARIWGALNLLVLFGLLAALYAAPRGSASALLPFAPVWVLVTIALLLMAFLIFNGARLLSGSGTLAGMIAWLLARAVPALIVFFGPVVGGGLAFALAGELNGWSVLGTIAGAIASWFVVRWLSQRFRARIEAGALPRAKDALWADKRRPILFLRSFTDDDEVVRLAPKDEPEDSISRLEDVISGLLRDFGPVIAVAEPGVLPKSGAAKAFYQGDDWQEAVKTWMDQALIVVMIAGYTPGLTWEMDTLIKRGHTKKLVLIIPPRARRVEERWARIRERFAYQPLGEQLAGADTTDVIALHADRTGNLVTFASPTQTTAHYQTALSLAIVGKFTDGARLTVPDKW